MDGEKKKEEKKIKASRFTDQLPRQPVDHFIDCPSHHAHLSGRPLMSLISYQNMAEQGRSGPPPEGIRRKEAKRRNPKKSDMITRVLGLE